MKKIIFCILCGFISLNLVNAISLNSEETSYYINVKHSSFGEKIINLRKIYDEENVLFNIDVNNYDLTENFKKYSDYSENIWKYDEDKINKFSTIVHYGYLNNPSLENYLITQVMVWALISEYEVEIVNKNGEVINSYDFIYNNLLSQISNHYLKSKFFNKSHTALLWVNNRYTYDEGAIILDIEKVEGLTIDEDKNYFYVSGYKVGNYDISFTKDYDQEIYCYSDGKNIYWQSLKGPEDIEYNFRQNIVGTKLNIVENLIGINNKIGDAKLNSKYEIYYQNELKITTNDLEDIYVRNGSSHILKDISKSNGVNNVEDIEFTVMSGEYTLNIDKYVVSKNLSVNVLDNNDYYIYLKSNNELYEVINKDTEIITLPFGIYYIKDNDNYYKEIVIEDSIDEELVVGKIKEEVTIPEKNIEENDDSTKEVFEEEYIEIENPQTLDNINTYIIMFFMSLGVIVISKRLLLGR